ncbi:MULTISPECIES: FKBP-type peptidyl-prolyl cis-trans isomerase [unclassified Cellulophaga]|uniref:FKBP-type peptidyl-prolyl cis-trans isomerase n=1 Tax=unclassified Cellulophaga TaxID=2634405 RepID=UPI0026E172BB|nr:MULTISPECIES: FKBP-type peptidyl-prolyl cis-trans isomerase [unclassified Cellulophaga]MDO6492313.1 FKBP-type peptidyl-prolyl cis-trans isomerase [Cellulophaga sp. 2_MG-2023]MDO6493263.1 FKBP-type peptidyl-prolyl cis-trans isomerase [Cellulophaga sp. 3_MG-2023]
MKYGILILVFTLFISCKNDDVTIKEPVDYTAQNEAEIKTYIEKNNLTALKSDSGLYYVINDEGNGIRPTATSDVTVAYKGYFTDGNTFDESDTNGISFNLQQVIAGWTEGITYFKEGGNGVLLIPSRLGYGSNDVSRIPGGSVIIFDINLLSVNQN